MKFNSSETKDKLETKEHKYGMVLSSKKSFLSKFFSTKKTQDIDMYVTCLYAQSINKYNQGVKYFLSEIPNILKKRFMNIKIILALEDYEKSYWEETTKSLKKLEPVESKGHEWLHDRFFIIITKVAPIDFSTSNTLLISFDVTDLNQSEMNFLITGFCLSCGKNKYIPKSGKYITPLLEQNLDFVPGADQRNRGESALDIISVPVLVIPALKMDFKYCKQEIRDRFKSIYEETYYSKPGAAPYSDMLLLRRMLEDEEMKRNPLLQYEKKIRNIWD